MKSRLTAVTVCVALQSATLTWSQQSKPNAHALTPLTATFTDPGDARADGIDDYIKSEMAKRRIPGLAVGIMRIGELVKAQGYGKSNLETDSGCGSPNRCVLN